MKGMLGLLLVIAITIPAVVALGDGDVSPSEIIITEFLPDPAGSDLDGEFIEIMNDGSAAENLKNWSLTDQDGAVDFTFPDFTLSPQKRAVIYCGKGSNSTDNGIFYMGKRTSMLNNKGDDILLLDSTGSPADYVSYGNGSMVDPPPEGMEATVLGDEREGLSFARFGDDGKWGICMPTPGERNPSVDAGRGTQITAFYPYARYSDEFFVLENNGSETTDICGSCITDGEGYLYLPHFKMHPGERIYITENRSGFIMDMGFSPDLTYSECYTPSSFPRLSNSGDDIHLLTASGEETECVRYGDDRAPKRGYIYELDGNWTEVRAGRSDFPVLHMNMSGNLTVFSSPGSSLRSVEDLIDTANDEIMINVYSFRSQEIAQSLLSAMARGVKVTVLVEGNPVGGMSNEEKKVLSVLKSGGADVRVKNGSDAYRYDHAKYMIVDSQELLVESENFNADAMRTDGSPGNRGWGIILRNRSAAEYMENVFEHDSNLKLADIEEFEPVETGIEWRPRPAKGPEGTVIDGNSSITLFPGPETGISQVIDAIDSATQSVYVEQFYIIPYWNGDSHGSPLLNSLIRAAERGCRVRVLLDGSYYNIAGKDDNDEVAAYLNSIGKNESLDMEARIINSKLHGLVKVHNKGMIIDGKKVMISSFNWGENSFTQNRELGLFADNPEAAEYFTELFLKDWKSDFTAPTAVIDGFTSIYANETYNYTGVLSHDDTGIASFTWTLDNRTVSRNSSLSLSFTEKGSHILILNVSDSEGNWNTSEMKINVEEREKGDIVRHIISEIIPSADPDSTHDGTPEQTPSPQPSPASDEGSGKDSTDKNTLSEYALIIPALLIIVVSMKISGKKGHS